MHKEKCPELGLCICPMGLLEHVAKRLLKEAEAETQRGITLSLQKSYLDFKVNTRQCGRKCEPGEAADTGACSIFQYIKKLFLTEQAGRAQVVDFLRKNVANSISMANLVTGLFSILCTLNGLHHSACWLVLIGFLLDLADGAVARQLNACSALGAKLDDFADFTTFGLATALLLQAHGILDGVLAIVYVLAVFTRLCFFSSGIPFTYRGLPCPYGSSVLASTYLLTGGNLLVIRIVAMVMILFMVDRGCYPHDKVLESQAWKKVVYVGGEFPSGRRGRLSRNGLSLPGSPRWQVWDEGGWIPWPFRE
uniref:Uncharacterized protein n=1 Tax=Sphaerodactylus townsendi TaxID=933632 RepID=A0ACB8EEK8_9SAUR